MILWEENSVSLVSTCERMTGITTDAFNIMNDTEDILCDLMGSRNSKRYFLKVVTYRSYLNIDKKALFAKYSFISWNSNSKKGDVKKQ